MLVEGIPGGPHTPTPLARLANINRVIASKLLNALARPDAFEVLQQLPGPESLRAIANAAARLEVPRETVDRAHRAIEQFAMVIRHDFGTRGALNAAISPQGPELARRFELASRYQVYKGMRQIRGVEAATWINTMLFMPSPESPDFLQTIALHGAIGMRRLRPDVNVYFTAASSSRPSQDASNTPELPVTLEDLYSNAPAPLKAEVVGDLLVHRLVHDQLGKKSVVDMLAIARNPLGSRRYSTPERPRGGAGVFPDIPVKTLIFDILLHEEAFPGSKDPTLIVFNTGVRGMANPHDPSRNIDRITIPEQIEALGVEPDRLRLPEAPNYAAMIGRICKHVEIPAEKFRLFRLRVSYPVHGCQFIMAFDAPAKKS